MSKHFVRPSILAVGGFAVWVWVVYYFARVPDEWRLANRRATTAGVVVDVGEEGVDLPADRSGVAPVFDVQYLVGGKRYRLEGVGEHKKGEPLTIQYYPENPKIARVEGDQPKRPSDFTRMVWIRYLIAAWVVLTTAYLMFTVRGRKPAKEPFQLYS